MVALERSVPLAIIVVRVCCQLVMSGGAVTVCVCHSSAIVEASD